MEQPLAYRMKPKKIEDIVGQKHIIGESTPLYKMLKEGHVPSILLYGKPGTGKTSIAISIAGSCNLEFYSINATQSTKKDIEYVASEARLLGKVLLFIDEIHRFNKLQQDTLLPYVENGSIVLIGATTENPYHDVNPAIRSRCGEIVQLHALKEDDIIDLLNRAETHPNGLKEKIHITYEQKKLIATASAGDARRALTILESAYFATPTIEGIRTVEDDTLNSLCKRSNISGDKNGDTHYNLLSALQKSIRGSDVNASLYYLAYLLEAGEFVSICRRLPIIAYEDIGLANREMGVQVLAAVDTAERVGMPEARIPLSFAVTLMSLSEKSNSAYKAIDKALEAIRSGCTGKIPMHLRDTHFSNAVNLGHVGYVYPHDYPVGSFGGIVYQSYLPDKIKDLEFYQPVEAGEEVRLSKIHSKIKEIKDGGK